VECTYKQRTSEVSRLTVTVLTCFQAVRLFSSCILQNVQIFSDGELVKTHVRSYGEGTWRTDETDYPPHKSRYLLKTTEYYQQEAFKHGEYVCQVVIRIMTEHAYRNLWKVQAIFRLSEKYDALFICCHLSLSVGNSIVISVPFPG